MRVKTLIFILALPIAGCSIVHRAEMKQEMAESAAYIEHNCPKGDAGIECRQRLLRLEEIRLQGILDRQAQQRAALVNAGTQMMQQSQQQQWMTPVQPVIHQPTMITCQHNPYTVNCQAY